MTTSTNLETWLQHFLTQQHATSGTVHLFQNDGLKLAATVNIPPQVQQIVAWVPNGKGMAGLALQRNEPVQTCNLKEDSSGNVKPGAKAVDAKAAVALPVRDASGKVRAVVGIAFLDEREFTPADLDTLMLAASLMPDES
ncbi:MAG TPA: GAF domain-containing protein [Bryobacteraceae bacterium]|nr:GAF domain-containing protein [Bryobacteraceae bacterium]